MDERDGKGREGKLWHEVVYLGLSLSTDIDELHAGGEGASERLAQERVEEVEAWLSSV